MINALSVIAALVAMITGMAMLNDATWHPDDASARGWLRHLARLSMLVGGTAAGGVLLFVPSARGTSPYEVAFHCCLVGLMAMQSPCPWWSYVLLGKQHTRARNRPIAAPQSSAAAPADAPTETPLSASSATEAVAFTSQLQRNDPMKASALLSLFGLVGQFVGPLVTMADQAAHATGNQKLEAVTGTLIGIHDSIAEVTTDAAAIAPQVAEIVGKFADMKHSLDALAVKAAAPATAAAPAAGAAAASTAAATS